MVILTQKSQRLSNIQKYFFQILIVHYQAIKTTKTFCINQNVNFGAALGAYFLSKRDSSYIWWLAGELSGGRQKSYECKSKIAEILFIWDQHFSSMGCLNMTTYNQTINWSDFAQIHYLIVVCQPGILAPSDTWSGLIWKLFMLYLFAPVFSWKLSRYFEINTLNIPRYFLNVSCYRPCAFTELRYQYVCVEHSQWVWNYRREAYFSRYPSPSISGLAYTHLVEKKLDPNLWFPYFALGTSLDTFSMLLHICFFRDDFERKRWMKKEETELTISVIPAILEFSTKATIEK